MKKIVKKILEVYAKSSTNSCFWVVFLQPKAPRCLIQK